jgi:hypothetical protein
VRLGNQPTTGLIATLDRYDADYRYLRHLERAAAKMVLDTLDTTIPPTKERDAVRQKLLDVLAWHRKEIIRWLASQSEQQAPLEE